MKLLVDISDYCSGANKVLFCNPSTRVSWQGPMRLFNFTAVSALFATSILIQTVPASANGAEVCRFERPQIICAESTRDGEVILNAMASVGTRELFRNAIIDGESRKSAYADGYEREDFRKSLEANRKSMTRYADRAQRQYRRRRISEEDYEAIRRVYEQAVANYALAMDVYRAGTWFDTSEHN